MSVVAAMRLAIPRPKARTSVVVAGAKVFTTFGFLMVSPLSEMDFELHPSTWFILTV